MKPKSISSKLLEQLGRVPPSTDDMMQYRPCRATLTDGRVLDRVYVAECESYIRSWGVWPNEDEAKKYVLIEDVASIENSPVRLPAHLANKMYRAGESGMGGCVFTLILKDKRCLPQISGNAVDFPSLPDGVTPDMIMDLIPHEGREESPSEGPDYYWCLYSNK